MAISKDITLTITKGKSILSTPISIYQNDRGVDIYITIDGLNYDFADKNNMHYSTSIVSPNKNREIRLQINKMIDGKIKFEITKDLTDDLDEIGIYSIQFHLHDEETGSNKITIPETEFEVKKTLLD